MISTNAMKAPSSVGAFAVYGATGSAVYGATVSAVCGTDAFAVRGALAAERTTGLPLGTAVRLRPAVDVPMTGLPIGAVQLNSHTPGDLPPRDPLS